jgi:hypothetical protein
MSDIKVDTKGCMCPIMPKNRRTYTLAELQSHVGGLVELIDLGLNYLVVNCNAQLLHFSYNSIATMWLNTTGNPDYIFGDALLINKKHIE